MEDPKSNHLTEDIPLSIKTNNECIICVNIKDQSECGECQIKRGELDLPVSIVRIGSTLQIRRKRMDFERTVTQENENGNQKIDSVERCACKKGRSKCRNVSCRRKLCILCSLKCAYCHLCFCKDKKKECLKIYEEHINLCKRKQFLTKNY